MIYLQLFLNFLMIGALSFGGGYGMISLVRETVLRHGWLTEAEFLSFIAVSESTPGPLAINMATFIGSSQGGFPGALIATLGVVLPSFFIILLIAAVLKNLMKYAGVEAFLSGVRPCVVAMILATALNMMLSTLGGIKTLADGFAPDARSILVFAVLWMVHFVWKKRTQKAPSPIGMILLAAGLNPVLGRMRDHRPFFVAQCSTNSPRRANMWSMGPEPLPRSSMADRQPEIYALARSTAASRG